MMLIIRKLQIFSFFIIILLFSLSYSYSNDSYKWPDLSWRIAHYAIGSIAGFWTIERIISLSLVDIKNFLKS